MSNAEAIARTMKEESGWDSYNENAYDFKIVTVMVRGVVKVYKPSKDAERTA